MADSPANPPPPDDRPMSGEGDEHDSSCLPIGTRLGEFEITGLIGIGGFGIVYSARDHLLEREVAIKEYMPSALATRTSDYRVSVKSQRHQDTFAVGLRSFVNEAKMLAQFDHPSLVKVYRFWEANGTAYMVMPFYRGTTLRSALKTLGEAPEEAAITQMLRQLLDALDVIHAEQVYHRDIAPDNILILQSGRPVLLDFGAARRVIGDMTQALTVILKPGFAPFEQYADDPGVRQGPWTDIYALAAVVYYSISGKAPTPSPTRIMRDTMVPAREVGKGHYSESFLAAIDHALAVHVEDRIQSISQLRVELGLQTVEERGHFGSSSDDPSRTLVVSPAPVTTRTQVAPPVSGPAVIPPAQGAPAAPPAFDEDKTVVLPVRQTGRPTTSPGRPMQVPTPGADPLGMNLPRQESSLPGESPGLGAPSPRVGPSPAPGPAPVPAPRAGASAASPAGAGADKPEPKRRGIMVAAGAGILVLGSAGVWRMMSSDTPPSPPGKADPKIEPKAEPKPEPKSEPKAEPKPEPKPEPKAEPKAEPKPEPPPPEPFDPKRMFKALYDLRDPAWAVDVKLRSDTLKIGKDRFQFRISSARAGYLYVMQIGTEASHFWQLFPNGIDRSNRIDANKELVLPRQSWAMTADGPPGTNELIALITPSPRDFSSVGLQTGSESNPIGEFDFARAQAAWQREGVAPFAGKPINCTLGELECQRFGAVTFRFQEVN